MAEEQKTSLQPPAWCDYPEPHQPARGCWSLLNGWITKREDCAECECCVMEAGK